MIFMIGEQYYSLQRNKSIQYTELTRWMSRHILAAYSNIAI